MSRIFPILIIALLITPFIARAETINGCVTQSSGKLRIVGVPGQCKANETPLSWESEGPQGPPGTSLILLDGNGLELGPFTHFLRSSGSPQLAFFSAPLEALVLIQEDNGEIVSLLGTSVRFADPNCEDSHISRHFRRIGRTPTTFV